MPSIDALKNSGLVEIAPEGRASPASPRTLIVLGPARSGTSAVAGILHHLGVFMGDRANPPVFEDVRLAKSFETTGKESWREVIRDYDRRHAVWGFKRPALLNRASELSPHLRRPHFLITFKDLLSIANRNRLSARQEITGALRRARDDYDQILAFISESDASLLLISYEKLIARSEESIQEIASYCGLSPSPEQLERARSFLSPDPEPYLAASRSFRAQGKIEEVTEVSVSGWARSVRSTEPLTLVLFVDGEGVARTKADHFRQDLLDKGIHPQGTCGFHFSELPQNALRAGRELRVVAEGDVVDIGNSPFVLEDPKPTTSTASSKGAAASQARPSAPSRPQVDSMAQYQSFPDASGDSKSLDKLVALRLPDLAGRSFLDVGCNEGFFCGFARHSGASRVVGVDINPKFVERASRRFPDLTFHCGSWDSLPEGPFDTVLLASALHYADDQEALIHQLMTKVSSDGTLVLELGIVRAPEDQWIKMKRGIDERYFPTMAVLRRVLEPYAWKHIGESPSQAGDPVPRHVLHLRHRQPYALLLMSPPASGKSTLARNLFQKTDVQIISGDQLMVDVARGKRRASARIEELVQPDFSPYKIGEKVAQLFEDGLGSDYVTMVSEIASEESFILDASIPSKFHDFVAEGFRSRGFFPVSMSLRNPGHDLPSAERATECANEYFASLEREGLAESPAPPPNAQAGKLPDAGAIGIVERISIGDGVAEATGWAVSSSGAFPEKILFRTKEGQELDADLELLDRPDVRRHFSIESTRVGFRASVKLPGHPSLPKEGAAAATEAPFDVFVTDGGRQSGPLRVASLDRLQRNRPAGDHYAGRG